MRSENTLVTRHDLKSHPRRGPSMVPRRVTGWVFFFAKSGNIDGKTRGEVRGRDATGLNRGYRYRQSRGKPLRAVSEAYRSCAARTRKQGGPDPFNCRDNVGIRVKTHQTSAGNDHVQELPLSFSPPCEHSRFRPCTLLLSSSIRRLQPWDVI